MRQLKIATQITNRDSDAVEKYLQEIGKYGMISPEEEVRIAQSRDMFEPGTPGYANAVDKLVKANLRFVVSAAKQYLHQGLALSDLINEGNLGLIKAAHRFDETRGFKFISYAVWRIRQSILQALAEQSRVVRNPAGKLGTYRKILKVISDFSQSFEREPSVEEIADALDLSVTEVTDVINSHIRHSSLDAEIGGESEGATMLDYMAAESEEIFTVFNSKNYGELSQTLLHFVENAGLTSREKEIIYATYGFEEYTIDNLMVKYDLTKERIRQIKERAVNKLQKKATVTTLLKDDVVLPPKTEKPQEDWLQEKKPLPIRFIDTETSSSTKIIIVKAKDETLHTLSDKKNKKTYKKSSKNINSTVQKPFYTNESEVGSTLNESLDIPTTEINEPKTIITPMPNFEEITKELEGILLSVTGLREKLVGSIINTQEHILLKEQIAEELNKTKQVLETYRDVAVKYRTSLKDRKIVNTIRRIGNKMYDIRQRLKSKKNGLLINPPLEQKYSPSINIQDVIASNPQAEQSIAPIPGIDEAHIAKREISEIKLKELILQKCNLDKYLDEHTINGQKKQCIKTFLHYYRETRKSALGKTFSYSEILQGAKVRSGYVINQVTFDEFIFEFLDSINLQNLE